eukprot:TRINITY_DN19402_c0_g1_i2.p1 TRINITY_DN19402_c0_g1~~TRINITY_DN19402_c0_g1_i2.p1  ORF type:complete len:170 (+),score=35.49 TRINITY_DN19402_c0_g1_i2:47-511(+)
MEDLGGLCADELALRASRVVRERCKAISDDQEKIRQRRIEKGVETDEQEGDGYRWVQSRSDVTITVRVPPGTRSSHLRVEFGPTSVQVCVRGTALLKGQLAHAIQPDDSVWTIDGIDVSLQMEKAGGPSGGGQRWTSLWADGTQPVVQEPERRV